MTDLTKSVQDFYEQFVSLMADEDPEAVAEFPAWDELDGEDVALWALACASTIETGVRVGRAVAAVTSGKVDEA